MLARSIATALLQCGVALRVVCCRPSEGCAGTSADTPIREPEVSATQAASLEVWAVDLAPEQQHAQSAHARSSPFGHSPLRRPTRFARDCPLGPRDAPSPRACQRAATAVLRCLHHGHRHPPPLSFQEDGWKRVDRECAWERFATGAAGFAAAALAFAPQACVAVDWHGAGAWRALSEAALSEVAGEVAGVEPPRSRLLPRPLYLNFRVYSSGTAPSERAFYEAREVAALETAAAVLALSARDQASLRALSAAAPPPALLLPPLRGDVRALALGGGGGQGALPAAAAAAAAAGAAGGSTARCFVSCVVRLSPEKEPMRFVELCEVRPYTAQTKNKLAPWQVLHLLVSGCDSGPSSRVTLSDTCSPRTDTTGARRRAPRHARPHSVALRRRLRRGLRRTRARATARRRSVGHRAGELPRA